ncbi:hypothetical protein PCURB6_43580 [Paenibacillus curdlanolyticus]|nr:hypothetical protein PCURB6_43580 [Paenibacillus curdlanolyticus]
MFHNHMTIELLAPYFQFNPEMWRLVDQFRQDIFEAAAASDMYGMIFTYVWAFDMQEDWDYVDRICKITYYRAPTYTVRGMFTRKS